MLFATLTDRGELTIPQSIRDALHVSPGSELFVSLEAGRVILEPRRGNSGRKLGEWLSTMQVQSTTPGVGFMTDVESYSEI